MIKNFIVSGCSFTKTEHHEWPLCVKEQYLSKYPEKLVEKLGPFTHINLAESGAGNYYIANSVQQYLLTEQLNPAETLVLVMWSGPGRIDLTVSDEYYHLMDYSYKTQLCGKNYVFSGGELGSWGKDNWAKLLFGPQYKAKNFETLARDTLSYIIQTRDFLENRGYRYKFMSYVNYWQSTPDFVSDMDLSIGYYLRDDPILEIVKNFDWIWADDNYGCIYEFAKARGLIGDDGFHPNEQAHIEFTKEVIYPNLERYFR